MPSDHHDDGAVRFLTLEDLHSELARLGLINHEEAGLDAGGTVSPREPLEPPDLVVEWGDA